MDPEGPMFKDQHLRSSILNFYTAADPVDLQLQLRELGGEHVCIKEVRSSTDFFADHVFMVVTLLVSRGATTTVLA